MEEANYHINIPDNRRETWQIAERLDIGRIFQVGPVIKPFSDLYFSSHTPVEQTRVIKCTKKKKNLLKTVRLLWTDTFIIHIHFR